MLVDLNVEDVTIILKNGDKVPFSEMVWLRKKAIKDGLVAILDGKRKGSVVLVLVLLANADEDTRLVKMTYKEMSKQTGFSIEFIRNLLIDFVELDLIEKLSSQGSSKTVIKINL